MLEMQSIHRELVVQARLIGAFKHPGTQGAMHLHRGFDDPLGNVFVKHRDFSSVFSVSSVVASLSLQGERR